MIKDKKTVNVIILCVVVTIVIIAFIDLKDNSKNDSKYYAEQFLEIVTTPEEAESTKFIRDILDSGKLSQDNMKVYDDTIKKEYGDLMTNKAFDNAILANKFIPWDVLILEDSNYSVKVDSIDVKKMSDDEDGRVHYGYSISLRVLFSDGENEAMTVSGLIVMMEKNDRWIVDYFRWNSDYQNIYDVISN